jgi:hypothetical protein
MAREPITGQVASIVNATELVINRGSEHGIRDGMLFGILDPRTVEVVDPETSQPLGKLWRPKVVVEVVSSAGLFALAKTFRTERVNLGGTDTSVAALTRLFQPPKWEERRETFDAPDSGWAEIDEARSVVKIGDLAEEYVRDLENNTFESGVVLEDLASDEAPA